MDYEEKYKEIVGQIKKAYLYAQTDSTKAVLKEIITELAESEDKDEKIRKRLITDFGTIGKKEWGGLEVKDILAWLEKQGQVKESAISQHEIETCKENNNSLTSEDEKIRKALIKLFEIENLKRYVLVDGIDIEDVLGWLERQGEHANFLSKIQVGDKVTRNEAGVLVNLSQLKRVAKPRKKQGDHAIYNVPAREVILAIWDLGNEWKELTNGCISTEYGTQLDYIQKHWRESEYYLRAMQSENPIKFNNSDMIDSNLNDYCCKIYNALDKENGGVLSFARLQHLAMDIYGWCKEYLQGEQKPADKVESHFRVEKGKWYMCIKNNVGITKGNAYYGISDGYIIDDNGRKYNCKNWAVFQGYLRLWDITKDARNGDVLAVTMYPEGTWIGIFKEQNGCTFSSYCFVNTIGTFKLGTYNHGNGKVIHPATKEQRTELFLKMHEAGYEWDAEKKELKKIEPKTRENKGNECEGVFRCSCRDEEGAEAFFEVSLPRESGCEDEL